MTRKMEFGDIVREFKILNLEVGVVLGEMVEVMD